MVVSHSRKKAKFTYDYRVLSALSQIQRDQKKHSVHVATLRAQIRKNAQENDDKLGPQWSNWVTRALSKLEEHGVVEASGAGNYTLTAAAKKALTAARRESQLPTLSQAGGLTVEDFAFKQIAKTDFTTTRGTKRARRRSSAAQSRYVSDDEDEEDGAPSASFSASARRRSSAVSKRARRQSSGKAVSKKTRAELEAELRQAQAISSQVNLNQTARLQQELDETRRQLAEAQEQLASPVRVSRQDNSRPHTPEPSGNGMSYASATAASQIARRRNSIYGLTRTESGSFINEYSKQPTPAPSTPGGRNFDMDDLLPPTPSRSNNDGFSVPHGLATPSSTIPYTEHVGGRHEQQEDEGDVFDGGSPLTPLQVERELQLEETSAHIQRLQQLQAELQEKSDLLAAKDASLVAEQVRADGLRTTVAGLEASCSQKESTIAGVKAQLNDAEGLVSSLRSEAQSRQEQYDIELSQLRASLASYQAQLEDVKQRSTAAAQGLGEQQTLVAALTEEKATLKAAYDALEETLTNVRDEHNHTLASLEEASEHLTEIQQSYAGATQRLSDFTEEVKQLKENLHLIATARSEAIQEKETVETELATVKGTVVSLRASLSVQTQELEDTKGSLVALQAEFAALQETHGTSTSRIETLQKELDAAATQVLDLGGQIQTHQARAEELTASRDETLQESIILTKDLTDARTRISELEVTADELTHRVQTKDEVLALLRTEIRDKDSVKDKLQEQLSSLQASYATLEISLAEKAGEVETLRGHVAALRSSEDDLRQKLEQEVLQRATERATREAEIARLNDSTRDWDNQVKELTTVVEAARQAQSVAASDLQSTQVQLDRAREDLDTARSQIPPLRREIDVAHTKVRDAEREIEELRIGKAQDAQKILLIQNAYMTLKGAHMKSFAEADSVVASILSSAMPARDLTAVQSDPLASTEPVIL